MFEQGIKYSMPAGEYRKAEGVNVSSLKSMLRTPAHYYAAKSNPADASDDQVLGEAVHSAILEPDRFEKEYCAMPAFEGHPNSNAYKEQKATWVAAHPSHITLTQADYDAAKMMRDAAWAFAPAREMLDCKGKNEVSVFWIDPDTSLPCKGRLDRIVPGIILDVKTTRDASVHGFARECVKYRYDMQAAFYLDGLGVVAHADRQFRVLAMEKVEAVVGGHKKLIAAIPHVRWFSARELDAGRASYLAALKEIVRCTEAGVWPGYPARISEIVYPEWFYRQEGSGDTDE